MVFQFVLVQLVHCLPCILENETEFWLVDLDKHLFIYIGQEWVRFKKKKKQEH